MKIRKGRYSGTVGNDVYVNGKYGQVIRSRPRRRSLNWINLAFFRLNAGISVIFLTVTLAEVVFLGGFRLR